MSVTDKAGGALVVKNADDADVKTRLREAALELFLEHGFERTTAAEIAAKARVTERTFFRYFPDKREVLFDREAVVREALTASIAEAPDTLGPLDTLLRAFLAFEPMLKDSWSYSKPRQEVIASTPALCERELSKISVLTDALSSALKVRGVPDLQALLAAQVGMAAFVYATRSWLKDPKVGYGERVDLAFRELTVVLAQSS